MSFRNWNRSSLRTASRARLAAVWYWGRPRPTRIPMRVKTMIISMRVNPRSRPARCVMTASPFIVPRAVEGLGPALRIDIIDVLLPPDVAVAVVLVGPEPPFGRRRHRVPGNAAQEADQLLFRFGAPAAR